MVNSILVVNGYPSSQQSLPIYQGQGFLGWKAKAMLIDESDELFDFILGNLVCSSEPVEAKRNNGPIIASPIFETWQADHLSWTRRDDKAALAGIFYLLFLILLC